MKHNRRLPALLLAAAVGLCGGCAAAAEKTAEDDPARLKHMIVTLLTPAIQAAAEEFYEPYLTVKPTVAAYYGSELVEIRGAERVREGVYGSSFAVTVEVFPYVGPHLSVGKDRVTVAVKADGTMVAEDFQHLESHPLPPHYRSILKQPLP